MKALTLLLVILFVHTAAWASQPDNDPAGIVQLEQVADAALGEWTYKVCDTETMNDIEAGLKHVHQWGTYVLYTTNPYRKLQYQIMRQHQKAAGIPASLTGVPRKFDTRRMDEYQKRVNWHAATSGRFDTFSIVADGAVVFARVLYASFISEDRGLNIYKRKVCAYVDYKDRTQEELEERLRSLERKLYKSVLRLNEGRDRGRKYDHEVFHQTVRMNRVGERIAR